MEEKEKKQDWEKETQEDIQIKSEEELSQAAGGGGCKYILPSKEKFRPIYPGEKK